MLPKTQPTTSIPINEIAWINEFLSMGKRLSKEDIESILSFSLIWNLFESFVCNRNASIASFERAVKKLIECQYFIPTDFDLYLNYFVERYTKNGHINHRFEGLRLPKSDGRHLSDSRDLVVSVLEGRETSSEKRILAMLIIVYRYRNNLFHGEKSLFELPDQINNFSYGNQVLMKFLEQWKKCGFN